MKTQLKKGIWLEGFDTMQSIDYCELLDAMSLCGIKSYIYKGKTFRIPEELAKECVEYYIERCKYKNYNPDKLIDGIRLNGFNYATLAIQSACPQEYCIIYKIK